MVTLSGPGRRSVLTLALAGSLAAHLLVIAAPGWRLPGDTPVEVLSAQILPAEREQHQRAWVPRRAQPKASRSAQQSRSPVVESPVPAAQPSVSPENAEAAVTEVGASTETPVEAQAAALSAASPTPTQPVPLPSAQPEAPKEIHKDLNLPRRGRIRYAVIYGERGLVVGQAVHRWSHDGKAYTINTVTETTGLAALFHPARMMQESVGEIDADGLKPHEYRTERNGAPAERASFDWSGGKLNYSGGGVAQLRQGSQDMLTLLYQLGELALTDQTQLMIATGKKFEGYVFVSAGAEQLETPFGRQRVLHLVSRAAGGGRDATEIWLGMDLRGLPLKVRYTDRTGDRFEQVAEEVEFGDNRLAAGSTPAETGR